jgi:beta-lactamase class A
MLIARRTLLTALLAAPVPGLAAPACSRRLEPLNAICAGIERNSGGRFGLAVLDTQDGARFGWNEDLRFPMCSTFKALLAGHILWLAERRRLSLAEPVAIRREDMIDVAPLTEPRIGQSMTLAELCYATVTTSDNPAANLLLRRLGGPAALTQWLRGLGDHTTRLDRNEPEMNEALPLDPRDTTTPEAMLATIQRLALGRALSPAGRRQLTAWMAGSVTGGAMLRDALPAGWREANKTGAGAHGTRGIVSLIHPPARRPILVAAYLRDGESALAARNAHFPPIARALGTATLSTCV